jgi:diadenosine tetraphosphate (Ap4A) HIT family hydrolase
MDEARQEPAGGGCPFCSPQVRAGAVATHGSVLAVPDARPVTEGHLLVITRRHTPNFFTMTRRERQDAAELLAILRERALEEDPAITGFNIGANCGASAGQRIPHAHIHFIPRRSDEEAPRPEGPKGVIRNKLSY